eukprot:EG_transcript_12526
MVSDSSHSAAAGVCLVRFVLPADAPLPSLMVALPGPAPANTVQVLRRAFEQRYAALAPAADRMTGFMVANGTLVDTATSAHDRLDKWLSTSQGPHTVWPVLGDRPLALEPPFWSPAAVIGSNLGPRAALGSPRRGGPDPLASPASQRKASLPPLDHPATPPRSGPAGLSVDVAGRPSALQRLLWMEAAERREVETFEARERLACEESRTSNYLQARAELHRKAKTALEFGLRMAARPTTQHPAYLHSTSPVAATFTTTVATPIPPMTPAIPEKSVAGSSSTFDQLPEPSSPTRGPWGNVALGVLTHGDTPSSTRPSTAQRGQSSRQLVSRHSSRWGGQSRPGTGGNGNGNGRPSARKMSLFAEVPFEEEDGEEEDDGPVSAIDLYRSMKEEEDFETPDVGNNVAARFLARSLRRMMQAQLSQSMRRADRDLESPATPTSRQQSEHSTR